MTSRRKAISALLHTCAVTAVPGAVAAATPESDGATQPQRYLLIGLCGSENPTRANFPFAWSAALKEAGNEVRLELAGDATVLMRTGGADKGQPGGGQAPGE